MNDRFRAVMPGVESPALGAFVISPSDATDLPEAIRAVTIGVGGAMRFVGRDGQTYQTAPLPAGTYPLFATRVLESGTLAEVLTGWI